MIFALKSFFSTLIVFSFCLVAASDTKAVPNPNAINWGASPTAFVTSLYVGVFGRSPENAAAVAGHAAFVTSSPRSRWNRFWVFINSPEYRRSRWAKQKRSYKLYQKYTIRSNRYTYTVSKGPLGARWRVVYGPTTFGIAAALRGYYNTYSPRR